MANISNTFFAGYKPEDIVLNIEKFFEEHPDLDSEVILIKYGNGKKVELFVGYDLDEHDEDAEKEYYIEAWNNFGEDEAFELGSDEPISTYHLSGDKEERLRSFYELLEDMDNFIWNWN